jgi:hypothetical protein
MRFFSARIGGVENRFGRLIAARSVAIVGFRSPSSAGY